MPVVPSVVPEDLVVSMRSVSDGQFGDSIGPTVYLMVPPPTSPPAGTAAPDPTTKIDVTVPAPGDARPDTVWFAAAIREASRGFVPPAVRLASVPPPLGGDLLIFIHGFNNSMEEVMQRHRQLRKDLTARGYAGAVVSFDWPCGTNVLGYLDDRVHASGVAVRLVSDLVLPFVARARLGQCDINVHVLCHSMGAYLFQETVDLSDEHRSIASVNWTVSQLVLIAADVDQHAMEEGSGDGESMLGHATRVTNYANPYDDVLKLSNAKRVGLEPRIGRVGLPADAPDNCVEVDCGDYYARYRKAVTAPCPEYGVLCHSWHVGDPVWTDDLYATLCGDLDRTVIPTRELHADGSLSLRIPPPPQAGA